MSMAVQPLSDHDSTTDTLLPLTVPLHAVAEGTGPPQGPLGQRLLGADLIAQEELEAALKHQAEKGQKLGESLLELGFANEDQLLPFIE